MDQSAAQLRVEIAETRTNMGETLEAIGDRVSPGRVVERRKNRMTRAFRDVRDRVMGSASGMGESVHDTATHTLERVEEAPDAVLRRSAGNPLMAGGVAFGVGMLVAAAFPPSRAERDLAESVGERIEPVKDAAASAVREVASDLKEPAAEAVQGLKDEARQGAGHVADQVQHDATRVAQDARSAPPAR
jgi:gas vesicle protein